MECKTAESDLPLIQAERTEDGEEPPQLLHFNAARGCAPSSRTQITIEIGPRSGTIPSYSYTKGSQKYTSRFAPAGFAIQPPDCKSGGSGSYSFTDPKLCTAALWDDRASTGSVCVGNHHYCSTGLWNIGRPPGFRQPEKLATMTPVGGPFLFRKELSLVGRRSLTEPSAAVRRPGRTQAPTCWAKVSDRALRCERSGRGPASTT